MHITSRNAGGGFEYQHASDIKINTLEFTFDQIESAWHQSGDSGQLWQLSIIKDVYTYHGVHLSVTNWFKLVSYEMQRLREGQDPQVYVAIKKSKHFWVVASECIPPFLPNGLTHSFDPNRPYSNTYSKQTVRNAII
jgi:hypothetical protein